MVENGKSEHHHQIPHIRISLSTKYYSKQTILNYVANFAKKNVFWVENEKS